MFEATGDAILPLHNKTPIFYLPFNSVRKIKEIKISVLDFMLDFVGPQRQGREQADYIQ